MTIKCASSEYYVVTYEIFYNIPIIIGWFRDELSLALLNRKRIKRPQFKLIHGKIRQEKKVGKYNLWDSVKEMIFQANIFDFPFHFIPIFNSIEVLRQFFCLHPLLFVHFILHWLDSFQTKYFSFHKFF